jgi:DNA-binding NtrC family response regulator
MVRQGLFREDLYYRLATLTVRVPPLRERRSDIAVLARHFVEVLNERFAFRKRLGPEALALLERHDWPGNVRELLHVVEAALVVCDGVEILPGHIPGTVAGRPAAVAPAESPPAWKTLEQMERAHIEATLKRTDGHRGNAARLLGMSERNLYRKLREYGLLP